MKAFLYTISIALILVMKAELIALAIAAVLWPIGLFGVTGGDILRLVGLTLGTFAVSLAAYVSAELKK
jgi:hypothetical protein|nr:MAG TPA: hypothetical protein [Caudoviricetes sp.]